MLKDKPIRTKVIRTRRSSKKPAHIETVPQEQVNSEWQKTICLPVVIPEIRESIRRKRIALRSAFFHTANEEKTAVLGTQNFDFTSHPRYSSDLTPSEFYFYFST